MPSSNFLKCASGPEGYRPGGVTPYTYCPVGTEHISLWWPYHLSFIVLFSGVMVIILCINLTVLRDAQIAGKTFLGVSRKVFLEEIRILIQ